MRETVIRLPRSFAGKGMASFAGKHRAAVLRVFCSACCLCAARAFCAVHRPCAACAFCTVCGVCFLHRVPPMCRACCLYAVYTPCGACFPLLCLLHTRLALPALCSVPPSCAPLRGVVTVLIALFTRHAVRFQAAQRQGSKKPLHFAVEGENVPGTGYRSPRMRMMRIRMGSTH